MDIKDIRRIGARLKREILPHLDDLQKGAPIGKGAAGDTTHPIDKRAEDIVIEELERLKQPVTVVSEECGFKDIHGGGLRLLIDPIDGSRNAVSGVPMFSTSIALVGGENVGDTVAGYVLNITSGDEYWTEKGKGAYLNSKELRVQQDDVFRVIAYEAQTPKRDIPAILPLLLLFNRARCFGSTALDMAFLAQGALTVFTVPSPSRSFDFAAGYLLVREAGGIVTNLAGDDISNVSIGVKRSTPLLASANEVVHAKALNILMKV